MAIAKGQLQRVLSGRLDAIECNVDLACLQDRITVALDFGRRRVHPQKLRRQYVSLLGSVLQFQRFRCLV